MEIDIEKLYVIKEELDALKGDERIFVQKDGFDEFVILPVDYYDELVGLRECADLANLDDSQVKIVTNAPFTLSYEEYEKIRKQLIDSFDKRFKPNPEKLN